jgi:Cu(I)/Ag(I) efflux system membrane fusion protein
MRAHTPFRLLLLPLVAAALLTGGPACRRPAAPGGQAAPAAQYVCPMHPQIVKSEAGDCPICGMKLVPRDAPEPAAGAGVAGRGEVTVTEPRAQLLGIRSEPVGTAGGAGPLRTVGRVAADERRRQVVHARYEGYVERLHVDFTGQPVGRGQPLLEIYSPELVAAQEEYLLARRAQARLGGSSVPGVAESGGELAEAARQRLRYYDVGAAEIEALERSGQARRTVTLRAPVAGVVVEKLAFAGMKVAPADRLYEIADLSRVWVLADVYERDLPAVRAGTAARVSLPHLAGREWAGKVAFVAPSVKPETRTVEVRLEVDNAAGLLKPDMFADRVLTVPESAVVFTGERTLVFVDRGQGRYEPREVALGARLAGGYEVQRGVAAGEKVVVSANFLLDSESSLRATIGAASPHAGH